MAVRIDIRVDDSDISATLRRVYEAGLDPQPLHDRIGAAMVQRTQERFIAETDPEGRKWAPHAKSTVRKRGAGAAKLRDRMHLYDTLTHEASDEYARWGSGMAYAAAHQFGAKIERMTSRRVMPFAKNRQGKWRFAKKRSKAKSRQDRLVQSPAHVIAIPARPYLGVDETDKKIILDIAEAYLKEAAEGK